MNSVELHQTEEGGTSGRAAYCKTERGESRNAENHCLIVNDHFSMIGSAFERLSFPRSLALTTEEIEDGRMNIMDGERRTRINNTRLVLHHNLNWSDSPPSMMNVE